MNIAFFGGTFDPIHHGHIALARAATERFSLGRILFVPANVPPHKQRHPISDFSHRYAMVSLATTGEKTFIPSLLEAPGDQAAAANYSIDTIRRIKKRLKKIDRLYFLIGIDAFKDIAKWHQSEALFKECEFIVASRPGYSLADVANSLPESLRPKANVTKPFSRQPAKGALALNGVTVHLLENVHQPISATLLREAIAAKKPLSKFLHPDVADYIKKTGLYAA